MSNKVFLNEHKIIECRVVGDQTIDTVTAMGEHISDLLAELKKEHRPLLILDDVTNLKTITSDGRQAVVSLVKNLRYDRLVMLGSNGLIRLGVNLIARAAGQSRKLRYFTRRDEAVRWLLDM